MARYESSEPIEIMDRLLWRDAQQMLDRHAEAGPDGRCAWCGWQWPCPPRRLAERAELASRQPWRESWTARHDLNDLRTLPSWRAEKPVSLGSLELVPAPEPAGATAEEYAPAHHSGAVPAAGNVQHAPARTSGGARQGPVRAAGAPTRLRRNGGLFD